MKLSVMVLPSKEVLFADKKVEVISSLSMPLLSHWVLKLSEVLWAKLFQRDLTFQLKSLKFSPLILITKKLSPFKFLKDKDHLLKTTICWEDSILLEFQQLQEEPHKLKLPLKSIKTQSFQLLQSKKVQERKTTSLLKTKTESFLMPISKECWEKLKNSLNKIK